MNFVSRMLSDGPLAHRLCQVKSANKDIEILNMIFSDGRIVAEYLVVSASTSGLKFVAVSYKICFGLESHASTEFFCFFIYFSVYIWN